VASLPDVLPAGPVELHRWRVSHLESLLQAVAASFPELHRWMPWAATMPTAEDQRRVLATGAADFDADREWAYLLFESGEDGSTTDGSGVVGAAGLHRRSGPGTLEIGYWVRTDRTGRGYATAAARALTDAALTLVDGIDRVEIRMDRANRASAAVPPKLGFRLLSTVDRDLVAAGSTGEGLIWAYDRPS